MGAKADNKPRYDNCESLPHAAYAGRMRGFVSTRGRQGGTAVSQRDVARDDVSWPERTSTGRADRRRSLVHAAPGSAPGPDPEALSVNVATQVSRWCLKETFHEIISRGVVRSHHMGSPGSRAMESKLRGTVLGHSPGPQDGNGGEPRLRVASSVRMMAHLANILADC